MPRRSPRSVFTTACQPAKVDDELGHLARVFNSLLARLEQSFEHLRRFTSDASHELRTPLTVHPKRWRGCITERRNSRGISRHHRKHAGGGESAHGAGG